MSGGHDNSETSRLVNISLDERTVVLRSADVEHERAVAIFDLLEDNYFALAGDRAGPYSLHLSVRDNRLLFQFVVKERFSGTVAMREAIHNEILLVTDALAADLARFDEFSHISHDDLRTISDLVVNTVITLSERILDVDPDNAEDDALMLRAEKQLRLIFMGVGRWESRPADADTTA